MVAVRHDVRLPRRGRSAVREKLLLAFRNEAVPGRQRPGPFGPRKAAAHAHTQTLNRPHAHVLKWKDNHAAGKTFLVVCIDIARRAAITESVKNPCGVIDQAIES